MWAFWRGLRSLVLLLLWGSVQMMDGRETVLHSVAVRRSFLREWGSGILLESGEMGSPAVGRGFGMVGLLGGG